jgi:protein gp37
MSANTGISWTDRTWNPVVGCTKVSQGCKHCYAKTLHDMRHKAFAEGKLQNIPQYAQPFETVQTLPDRLNDPYRWRKPSRVFVNSMSDLFHDDVPGEFIAQVFAVMSGNPQHTFQVLTKRPARMLAFVAAVGLSPLGFRTHNRAECSSYGGDGVLVGANWPLPNVWLGVSVENQAAADERIPLLLQTPAAIRFLSCEPLLGPIDFYEAGSRGGEDGDPFAFSALRGTDGCDPSIPGIDWVIVGGESGKGARPMHPDWARSLRDQCVASGVAFHFKQWGEFREYDVGIEPELVYTGTVTADVHAACAISPSWVDPQGNPFTDPDNLPDETPCRLLERVGAKRAGRVLDGRTWDEFPAVAP